MVNQSIIGSDNSLATRHYMNQLWVSLPPNLGATQRQWVRISAPYLGQQYAFGWGIESIFRPGNNLKIAWDPQGIDAAKRVHLHIPSNLEFRYLHLTLGELNNFEKYNHLFWYFTSVDRHDSHYNSYQGKTEYLPFPWPILWLSIIDDKRNQGNSHDIHLISWNIQGSLQ